MKQKKPSSLARILGYAGGHKNLTILGCVLSALSAVLGLAPYLCVWLVARSVLSAWPSLDGAGDLGRWGWMAVWTAIGSILLYFSALMSTHIAAFRTARNIRRAAMTHVLRLPLGFFFRESVGAAAQAHRRQRRAHRGPAGPQAPRPGSHGSDAHRRHRRAVPL